MLLTPEGPGSINHARVYCLYLKIRNGWFTLGCPKQNWLLSTVSIAVYDYGPMYPKLWGI